MVETNEVLWLHEDSDRGRFATAFPVHVRSTQAGGRTVFAEVFWGDLSQLRRGIFGLVRGMFELVFGLRYVAYVAGDQPGRAARLLQWLGLVSARALHGPVLAVNFVLATVILAMAGTELLWPGYSKKAAWSSLVIFVNVVTTLVIATSAWRIATNRIIERFWFWVIITSMFLGTVLTLNLLPSSGGNIADLEVDSSRQLYWYARVLVVTMGLLWFSLMVMVMVMGVSWLIAKTHSRCHRRGLDIALLLPMLAVGGWGQFLPMIWLFGENALRKVAKVDEFEQLFREAVPLLGIQFVMCIVLALVQLLVLIYYAVWRPRNDVENYRQGAGPPRLIVNLAVQVTTAACACVAVSFLLLLGWNEIATVGPHSAWLLGIVHEADKFAIWLTVPLMGLFFVAFRYLGSALDIVLDVVSHFYFRRSSEPGAGMKFEDEFEGSEMSFDSGRLYFSRRALIHSRMIQILTHFRRQCGDHRPNLTIVSHSQGTMIAIEVLNNGNLRWLRESFGSIRLVTMGSPFSHLYQYYFANHYPPLDRPYWSNLRQNVDRWLNIFRVDDFVGTAIDFPESLRADGGFECENMPVKRCGHINYWLDKQVIELLRRQGEFAWIADEQAKPVGLTAASSTWRKAG